MGKDLCVVSSNLRSFASVEGRKLLLHCFGTPWISDGESSSIYWDSKAWFEPCKSLELCFPPKLIMSARVKLPGCVAAQSLQC